MFILTLRFLILFSLNITWTEYKEIVQKLAIIKFDQACGYEASIELMEALVNRYLPVDGV